MHVECTYNKRDWVHLFHLKTKKKGTYTNTQYILIVTNHPGFCLIISQKHCKSRNPAFMLRYQALCPLLLLAPHDLSHKNWSPPKPVPPERPRQKSWSPGTFAAEKFGAQFCSLRRCWLPLVIARCFVLCPSRAASCAARFTFTLANVYHKTMHNPNPTLNYLFLYHETNCDMNHHSYLWLTASAK